MRVPGGRCGGEDVADHLVHDERLPQRVRPHRHRHLRRRRTRRRRAREGTVDSEYTQFGL